ncbi:pyruvyl transferase EpsO [Maribacter caenipelagi]|uniref:Pyruvyl transferase EpsO n=1 Tax=Maribacter caenipelagi TaxID=1447781 RepID=A0A4R7DCI8_9FLAO|nr:polysaccharide pyruvyl transferase family protein [Maribacter caenipelagi]TDS18647.1 pyruvyl transferase EpsO [Maribacter caenipelagi]
MRLEEIKLDIESQLSKIITEDYVLYDIPNHKNIGDQLIYQGELDFLKTLPYKCCDYSSVTFNFSRKIQPNTILLHGGGNFGDLYPLHQNFREKTIKNNPDKKIVIFSQTVHFESKKELERSAKVFNAHRNVTLCARDTVSFDILRKHFINCKVILLSDMALCSSYSKSKKPKYEVLIMKRKDIELGGINVLKNSYGYPEIDWPTYEESMVESIVSFYVKLNNKFSKLYFRSVQKNSVFGLLPIRNKDSYIKQGIDFLSDYKFVISTRLHGHILCLLLGIPSVIINNSYGKNKRFYNSWLKNVDNSYYAETIEEGIELYRNFQNEK